MKKIFNILTVAVLVLLMGSCDRKAEFDHETFATFNAVKYDLAENVGKVTIPVSIYNPTGAEVQVTVATLDGKAVKGTDYNVISPASGVLTFSGDVHTLDIEIEITSLEGEFTGSKDFKVQIASATSGLSVGNLNTANVTIIDLDHPLSAFIGGWVGTIASMGYQGIPSFDTEFNISADPADETFTKVIVDTGIDPFFYGMGLSSATYSAVVVDGKELVIIAEQPNGYDDVILLGFDNVDPAAASSYDHIRMVLNEDGTLTLTTAYGAYTPGGGGFYEIYLGGAVFTKK